MTEETGRNRDFMVKHDSEGSWSGGWYVYEAGMKGPKIYHPSMHKACDSAIRLAVLNDGEATLIVERTNKCYNRKLYPSSKALTPGNCLKTLFVCLVNDPPSAAAVYKLVGAISITQELQLELKSTQMLKVLRLVHKYFLKALNTIALYDAELEEEK